MNPSLAPDPHRLLREVSHELGVPGLMFTLLGATPMLFVFNNANSRSLELLVLTNTTVLVEPGVWYLLAGRAGVWTGTRASG
jgi:hypothetical protein